MPTRCSSTFNVTDKMKFERLEARYIVPEMKQTFSLGDVDGMPRNIGPGRDMIVLNGFTTQGIEAWSSIDTIKIPIYGSESTVESWALLQEIGDRFLGKDFQDPREAVRSLGYLVDHLIFQAAFANLFLDASAIEDNSPLFKLLGGVKDKVEVGVSISKNNTFEEIAEKITKDKFRRIKVKVGPTDNDFNKIRSITTQFRDISLMIDANSSFNLNNEDHRRILLNYGNLNLLMIEQPLAHNDISRHIELQKEFDKNKIPGRVCLDESIHTMEELRQAVEGGIPVINIKVTRVGGLDIAREMIEYCMKHGVDTWIGGMVELTTPGKAHSLAMASHPGVNLPSDISGTVAYFKEGQDPCVNNMERDSDGAFISVPFISGRGWEVDARKMDKITKHKIIFVA